jgi:hypothetical protein
MLYCVGSVFAWAVPPSKGLYQFSVREETRGPNPWKEEKEDVELIYQEQCGSAGNIHSVSQWVLLIIINRVYFKVDNYFI